MSVYYVVVSAPFNVRLEGSEIKFTASASLFERDASGVVTQPGFGGDKEFVIPFGADGREIERIIVDDLIAHFNGPQFVPPFAVTKRDITLLFQAG